VLELAWSRNSSKDPKNHPQLAEPLSNWNAAVTEKPLPAIVMNSTIVENGYRLLLGTTYPAAGLAPDSRENATALHCIRGKQRDVQVVTLARLSATFPWVTPTARAEGDSTKPHMVDGGYYDDYGMATLVEWWIRRWQEAGKRYGE
jgi:hypothetical protein